MKKIGIILCGERKLFKELTDTALQSGTMYYERHQSMILEYFWIETLKEESMLQALRQLPKENCLLIVETLSLEDYFYIKHIMPQVGILTKHFSKQLLKLKEGILLGKLVDLTRVQINDAICLFQYIIYNTAPFRKDNLYHIWYGCIPKEEGALKIMQILLNYRDERKECTHLELQLLASAPIPAYWQYELEDAIVQYFNEEVIFEVTLTYIKVQTDQIYYVIKTF